MKSLSIGQAQELLKRLHNDEAAQLLSKMSIQLERSDTALRLIAEDASRDQKERLGLIQRVAEKQNHENNNFDTKELQPKL